MSIDNQTAFTPKPNPPNSEASDRGTLSDSDNEFLTELNHVLATESANGEDISIPDGSETVATFPTISILTSSSHKGEDPNRNAFSSTAGKLHIEKNQISNTETPIQDDKTAAHGEQQHEQSVNSYFYISEAGFTVPIQRPVPPTRPPIEKAIVKETPKDTTPPTKPPIKLSEELLTDLEAVSSNSTHHEEHVSHLTEIWGTVALWSAFFCLVAFGAAIWYTDDMADRTFRLETTNKDLNSKINELLKRVDIITQALVNADQRIKQVDQRLGHQIALFTKYTAKRSEASQPRELTRALRNNQRQLANPQLEIIPMEDITTEDKSKDKSQDKPKNRSRKRHRNFTE